MIRNSSIVFQSTRTAVAISVAGLWCAVTYGQLPGRLETSAMIHPSNSCILVLSPEQKTVSAFSKYTGVWRAETIVPWEEERFIPYQGGDFVLVATIDRLHAYNARTGIWYSTPLPEGPRQGPIISAELSVMQAGNKLCAFSAHNDAIHSVELEPGETANITVYADMATAQVGNRLYAFSPIAGSWDSVELSDGE